MNRFLIIFFFFTINLYGLHANTTEQNTTTELEKLLVDLDKKSTQEKISVFKRAFILEKTDINPKKSHVFLHQFFAEFLASNGGQTKAIEHFKLANELYNELGLETDHYKHFLISSIGSTYLSIKRYDSADFYFNASLVIAKTINDTFSLVSSYNNLGLLHLSQNQYKNAANNFDIAINIYSKVAIQRDNFLMSMLDNIAETNFKLGDLNLAFKNYHTNLNLSVRNNNWMRMTQAQIGIADINILNNQFDQARDWIVKAENNLTKIKSHPRYEEFFLKLAWLRHRYYLAIGDGNSASIQLNSIYQHLDLIEFKKESSLDKTLSYFLQFDIDNLKSELTTKTELIKIQEEKTKLSQYIFFLILISGLLISTLIYLSQQKKIAKQKQEVELKKIQSNLALAELKNSELEKSQLALELEFKEKDLEMTALRARNELELKGEILDKLLEIEKLPSERMRKDLRLFISEFQQIQHSSEKVKVLLDNLEKVNIKFIDILKNQYPNLSKNEIELCSLIKLSMNSKEIALIKGNTYESIKVAKNRLKKKLNLDNQQSLDEFIVNF